MKNRIFEGKDIGDSAVKFFDKLAYFESSGKYKPENDEDLYIGRYQLGTDVLADIGWVQKDATWKTARFRGEAAKKWGLTNKNSFLNNPKAQDEAIMKSLKYRWLSLKKYSNKICQRINVPINGIYRKSYGDKLRASESSVKKVLLSKKSQGFKSEDLRGKSFILTSSGLLGAAHLCGQGAMSNAIGKNFKGIYDIPVDGNSLPCLFYHENLSGHDLSVIIGFKDSCSANKVVLKNDTQSDNKKINKEAKATEQPQNKSSNNVDKPSVATSSNSIKKESSDKQNASNIVKKTEEPKTIAPKIFNELDEEKDGVYIFNGQKFEEVWDTEEYRKDRELMSSQKAPEMVFVNQSEVNVERLKVKFLDSNMYNQNYIKYLEVKTGKKILEENKEDIELLLKIYDEATKDENGIGNIIKQENFDILREREKNSETIRIQNIIYYIFSTPIKNKGKIETLEYILGQFSAKYVVYPDKNPIKSYEAEKSFIEKNMNVSSHLLKNDSNSTKIQKNKLPEEYNKYLKGIKDIDDILIRVEKKSHENFANMHCENLIRELYQDEKEFKESFLLDENGVLKNPLSRRIIDNIIVEFLKVQTGFKGEKEDKYFDNHKYKDSNVIRNYLLWYVKRQHGIDLPSKSETGLFDRLEKIGKEIRITTVLNDWISSKSVIKVRNIRKISQLISEVYSEYRDKADYDKDKRIIQQLFKTSKEIRDYAANIDSMDIYSFYKEFYTLDNIVNPTGNLFVNDNCILKCTMADDISRLIIEQESVRLRGGKQANILDKKILPFKMCKVIGKCKPELLEKWEKLTDVKVRNSPALLNTATIKCKFGGVISIDDAGQNTIGTASDKETKLGENTRDADCEYKLLIDICKDINNNFMQTLLKKNCQKFSKNKKYLKDVENIISPDVLTKMCNVSREEDSSESKKKEYEKLLNENKIKMEMAKKETSFEKEKDLREKIYESFKEAYKRVKQLSNPALDTKGIKKNYGISLCDYQKKNFYSAKMLPVIAYGYLMKSGNFDISSENINNIVNELNDESNNKEAEILWVLNNPNYNVSIQENKSKNQNSLEVNTSDVKTWSQIGENLYKKLELPPTENDILEEIRQNGKVLSTCPFSLMEWNENHYSDVKNSNIDNRNFSLDEKIESMKMEDFGYNGMKIDDSFLEEMYVENENVNNDTKHENIFNSKDKMKQFEVKNSQKDLSKQPKTKTKEAVKKPIQSTNQQNKIATQKSTANNVKSETIAKKTSSNVAISKNDVKENSNTSKSNSCSGSSCPHSGVEGNYILDVVRIEELSLGTLSKFRILDPSGREVAGFNGYVVEREGPDTIVSGRKKRIVQGTHELRWHERPDKKDKKGNVTREGYLAIGVFNNTANSKGLFNEKLKRKVLIYEKRWILIHPVAKSSGLEGCLAPAKGYTKDKTAYFTVGSDKLFGDIIKFIKKIEGRKVRNWDNLRKFKLKVSNKI